MGKKSNNVYWIYHQQRKLVISVNVDSLSLYHPFSPVPWDPDVPEASIRRSTTQSATEVLLGVSSFFVSYWPLLLIALVAVLVMMLWSLVKGKRCEPNPWGSAGLEW